MNLNYNKMEQLKVGDRVRIVATPYQGETLSVGVEGVIHSIEGLFYRVAVKGESHHYSFYKNELMLIRSFNIEGTDSFETQIKQVATHLLQKPITSWEAINTYRITRLSAVIHELRKTNTITSVWENNGKTGKEKKRWTKYTLIK